MNDRPSSKVPSGRLSRFLQLGSTATRMAAGGAAEKMRRLVNRVEEELPHALLTLDNARLLAERLSRLRGAAMKVGQMLSMEGDNLLPPEFAKALEVLRSSAHRMPESQLREVLERELGEGWRSRLAEFELTPIASASIGQVHRARALSGQELALKIQYPGVAESIDSDVDNLRSLLSLTRLAPKGVNLDALTDEVKAELRREVDYTRELREVEAYRAAVGAHPDVRVPRAFPELSSARVLALELVPGVPLLTWAEGAPQEDRDSVGRLLFELLLRELFEYGLMQTDPNPANYFYDGQAKQLILLDFGASREVPPGTRELYLKGFRGLAARDEALLRSLLEELGVTQGAPPEVADLLVGVALEISVALEGGVFDFRSSTLTDRLHERGKALRAYQDKLRPPPPEYLFFQRKLGGTFLLCRNIGARFDCRQVLEERGVL